MTTRIRGVRRGALVACMAGAGVAGLLGTASAASAAQAPAVAASTCQYTVLDSPTPIYQITAPDHAVFYAYKNRGDVVAGPCGDAVEYDNNGTYARGWVLYLANGAQGVVNQSKVS